MGEGSNDILTYTNPIVLWRNPQLVPDLTWNDVYSAVAPWETSAATSDGQYPNIKEYFCHSGTNTCSDRNVHWERAIRLPLFPLPSQRAIPNLQSPGISNSAVRRCKACSWHDTLIDAVKLL